MVSVQSFAKFCFISNVHCSDYNSYLRAKDILPHSRNTMDLSVLSREWQSW